MDGRPACPTHISLTQTRMLPPTSMLLKQSPLKARHGSSTSKEPKHFGSRMIKAGTSGSRATWGRTKGAQDFSHRPRIGLHTHGWNFLRSTPAIELHTSREIHDLLQEPQHRLAVLLQDEGPQDPGFRQTFHCFPLPKGVWLLELQFPPLPTAALVRSTPR